jgi:hypothetical protein
MSSKHKAASIDVRSPRSSSGYGLKPFSMSAAANMKWGFQYEMGISVGEAEPPPERQPSPCGDSWPPHAGDRAIIWLAPPPRGKARRT